MGSHIFLPKKFLGTFTIYQKELDLPKSASLWFLQTPKNNLSLSSVLTNSVDLSLKSIK